MVNKIKAKQVRLKKVDPSEEQRLDPGSRGSTKPQDPKAKGLLGFLANTRNELEKVVWPNRTQLIGESTAVLLIVILFAAFISLIDQFFSWSASQIF